MNTKKIVSRLALVKEMTSVNIAATVYVGNVPWADDGRALYAALWSAGEVLRLVIPPDPMGAKQHRGFAYAEFVDETTALHAASTLAGRPVLGKPLRFERVTNPGVVAMLNGTAPAGPQGPPRLITGPPTNPQMSFVATSGTVGHSGAAGALLGAPPGGVGAGGFSAPGFAARAPYGAAGAGGYAGAVTSGYAGSSAGYGSAFSAGSAGAGASAGGGSAASWPTGQYGSFSAPTAGAGAGAAGPASSCSGRPAAAAASDALTSVRGAVDALPSDDLAAIASEVRALAAADPHGTRSLLLQYPSLTAALLLVEERLGALHAPTETLMKRHEEDAAALAAAAAASAPALAPELLASSSGTSAGHHAAPLAPATAPASGPSLSADGTIQGGMLAGMGEQDARDLVIHIASMSDAAVAAVAAADPEQAANITQVRALLSADPAALLPEQRDEAALLHRLLGR